MKIFSWNVNGLRSIINKGAFKSFISEYQPDIMCLQETKAQPGQAEIDLEGYQEFWNSAERKGYSGTAIISKIKPLSIKLDLPEEIIKKYNLDEDGHGDLAKEGRVIAAEFETFWLVCVYTPNAKDDLSRLDLRHKQWDPAFLEYVKKLDSIKPVIFCGDLNVAHQEIDLANPKSNIGKHGFTKEERAGFDAYGRAGFIDIFRQQNPNKTDAYTWWSHWANARARNVGWRIDYFLVSQKLTNLVQDVKIHPEVIGSDHCPISLEVKV